MDKKPTWDPDRTLPTGAPGAAGQPTVTLGAGGLASAPLPPPVEALGPYRIERKLGEGGMGQVFKAVDTRNGALVALKLLKADLARDGDFAARFLREAGVAGKVHHPNVVRVVDSGECEGRLFMALDFVDGGDVGELVRRRGVLTESKATSILIEAARGLQAMHEAGLVHRDIKPGNLFLHRDGRVLVGDLGLARQASGDDRMTMTGAAMGTPAYMSLEHIRGEADVDIRSDIYALGATLYKLVTGEEPYGGDTLYVVTHKVLTDPVPDPRRLNAEVSPALTAIIAKAMAKKREERYTTPAELIEDLEAAQAGHRLVHAFAVAVPSPSAHPAPQAHPPVGGFAPLGGGSLLGLPPRVLGLIIAVLVLGGGFALVVNNLQAPPVESEVDRPPWAAAAGRDEAGVWADLVLGGQRLRLRRIEAGTFTMGSPAGETGHGPEETARPVTLTRPFYLAESECLQSLYQEVTGTNPSRFVNLDLPVDRMSWHEAVAFCDLLSRRVEGLRARLPSEAEWEYACRAGTTGPYAGGALELLGWSAPPGLHGQWESHWLTGEPTLAGLEDWVEEHLRDPGMGPQAPMSRRPNNWGLYDMHGNVAEWCRDAWQPGLDYPPGPATDPVGDIGLGRALRGGSWYDPPVRCRSAARASMDPGERHMSVGLRLAVDG